MSGIMFFLFVLEYIYITDERIESSGAVILKALNPVRSDEKIEDIENNNKLREIKSKCKS